jgi:hypothetical protein
MEDLRRGGRDERGDNAFVAYHVFVELDFELGFGILDRLHVIFGIHDPIVSRELTC